MDRLLIKVAETAMEQQAQSAVSLPATMLFRIVHDQLSETLPAADDRQRVAAAVKHEAARARNLELQGKGIHFNPQHRVANGSFDFVSAANTALFIMAFRSQRGRAWTRRVR